MAFSTGDASRPQINITPLIDVLLVMLIIFMFIVSISQSQGLEAQIPQPAKRNVRQSQSAIVIQLLADARPGLALLKINDENVRWDGLKERLQKICVSHMECVAFIRGDDDVDFEYVADVIDIAKNAGVSQVALLPKGEK